MLPWRAAAPFEPAHVYDEGQAPSDHHPAGWGKLELHRFGELGALRWKVVVHSTARRKDGWSFNVVQMERFPAWLSYFHDSKSGTRVQSHRSADHIAGQLAQAFELYNWM